ncbi:MAG: ABC transporter permease [Planctomycetales bacterium]|nr:ABC transporter permease [Planctomycetales bacterium]
MTRFLAWRLAVCIPTTLVALSIAFIGIRLIPNNPILARFGQHAVPQQVQAEMIRHGWDRPLYEQLGGFVKDLVLRGDLGESFFHNESVTDGLARVFPATVELTLAALVIALPLGIVSGIVAAVWKDRWPDRLCMAGSLVGISVPVFFIGICLIYALPNMPTGRRLPPGVFYDRSTEFVLFESLLRGQWHVVALAVKHLCLPAIALSTIPAAMVARVARSAMLEVLNADYIRTAWAKGNPRWRVVLCHALPNAAIPIVEISGLQTGQLLAGAVLTETVFSWPGLGQYLVHAVQQSDYNVVQGTTLLIAALFVLVNLTIDLLHCGLDPRFAERGVANAANRV